MKMLLATLMLWLSANFDLPQTLEQPKLELVSAKDLIAKADSGLPHNTSHEIEAIYDPRVKTIFLSDRWSGNTPAELSIIVHELVHHLQHQGGLKFACNAAREELAYAAQEKWLGLFGESLATTFGLDPMTLKLKSMCL